MPKMKSRSSAKKRFRTTGSGKILRRGANRQHKSEHRPTKEMKRRKGDIEVSSADAPRVRRMLGG